MPRRIEREPAVSSHAAVADAPPPRPEPVTPKPTTRVPSGLPAVDVNRLVADRREREETAEVLFRKLADDEPLSAGERRLLKTVCPEAVAQSPHRFETWLKGEAGRRRAVSELQAAAGSGADRQADVARLAEAQQRQSEQAPELSRQIEELQARLNALAAAFREAADDVHRRNQAVAHLRQERLLPAFVAEELRLLEQSTAPARHERETLLTRVKGIEGICAWDVKGNREQIEVYARGVNTPTGTLSDVVFPRTRKPTPFGGFDLRSIDQAAWSAHLDDLRREADRARQRLAELGDPDSEIAAEVEALKNYWVPK